MKKVVQIFILFFSLNLTSQSSLTTLSLNEFQQLSKKERQKLLEDFLPIDNDTIFFKEKFQAFRNVLKDKNEYQNEAILLFRKNMIRLLLHMDKNEVIALLQEGHKISEKHHLIREKLVFEHYLEFEKYDSNKKHPEQLYKHLLMEYDVMKKQGFSTWKPYKVDRLLYHSGRFFHSLNDIDNSLHALKEAEKYIDPQKELRVYIGVLNLIQSIFQERNDNVNGIKYAQKILFEVSQNESEGQKYCNLWKGLSSIDISSMMLNQGKMVEAEKYAVDGYAFIKNQNETEMYMLEAEFNALMILLDVELKLKKYNDVEMHLNRSNTIFNIINQNPDNYFKKIDLYKYNSRWAEFKGDFRQAINYMNLLLPIQDSLERKNDSKKFALIQQNHNLETIRQQLNLVEKEKKIQNLWKNIAFLLLLLSSAIGYIVYIITRRKRLNTQMKLDHARKELDMVIHNFHEKSKLVDTLSKQVELMDNENEKVNYLEKLTNSTILTDDDWSDFKLTFEKVYPSFIEDMKSAYPDITTSELRFLVLEKLGLSIQEMANMLGVNKNTIHQTRYRFKKKLEQED